MTNSMSYTYDSLRSAIGYFLGYGRDSARWTRSMSDDIDFILMEGLRQYYYPPSGYVWSWLIKTYALRVSSFSTTLPSDFGTMYDPVTFYASDTTTPTSNASPLRRVPNWEIYRALHQYGYLRGTPSILSVDTPPSPTLSLPQTSRLLVFPVPTDDCWLNLRYMAKPEPLNSTTNTYPLGGEVHARTVLESCLAAAEAHIGDAMGLHQQRFAEALQSSIQFDMQHKLPETYGLNLDPSVCIGYDQYIKHADPYVQYVSGLGATQQYSDISEQLDTLTRAVSYAFGAGDGVIRTDDNSFLLVYPTTPASMTVNIATGFAWVSQTVVEVSTIAQKTFSAPTSSNRIDLIEIDSAGSIIVKEGTEATSPTEPTVDTDCIALATVSLTPTTTAITESKITDKRTFV